MKKNNKGFFLAETIVVIALVTTVMAFVYPNVSKLYETYQNRTYYYDQTEDIYALKAVYDYYFSRDGAGNLIAQKTAGNCNGVNEIGAIKLEGTNIESGGYNISYNHIPTAKINNKIIKIKNLYLVSYMASPTSSTYNFNRYLKSLKKTTYDTASYRLIGVFASDDDSITRYASIKIDNPNPNRLCNLGG